MRIDSAAQQALRRLAVTPDGKVLIQILQVELDGRMQELVTMPVEKLPCLQGRAQALAEIVSALRV